MRRVLLWCAGIILAFVLAAAAALFLLDVNALRAAAETLASGITGRQVGIARMDGRLGWTTRITLQDVSLGNPDWLGGTMAEIKTVRIAFRPLSLLFGRSDIPELSLSDVRVDLIRDKDGRANWQFPPAAEVAGEAAAPEERGEFPRIGAFAAANVVINLDDAKGEKQLNFTIDKAAGAANEHERVWLEANGARGKEALQLEFSGGGFRQLVESDAPYPLEVRFVMGKIEVEAKGTVAEPLKLGQAELRIAARGPSLAELFPLVPAPLPESPPFDLSGELSFGEEKVSIRNLNGRLGESDVAGWVSYRPGEPRPRFEGTLSSRKLDVDVLAGLVGVSTGTASAHREEQAGGLFPDTPIKHRRLHLADLDITLAAQSVASRALPIDSVELRFRLDDGRLLVKPFKLGVADGQISGEAALNAREEVPSADLDIAFHNLDLRPFFKGTEFVQETTGRFFGTLQVLGVGHSLDEMAANARGRGRIAMRGGSISGLLVEAAGVDVIESLMLVVDDTPVTIRCAIAPRLEIEDGLVKVQRAVIDTTDSTLFATGVIDLGREAMEIRVQASAKDFSLLDLTATVTVEGKLTSPSYSVGDLRPFPFFEIGEQEDLDCGRLLKSGEEMPEKEKMEAERSR